MKAKVSGPVPPIEDQIHRHFLDLEEERCRQLEALPRRKGQRKGAIQCREISKPWQRGDRDGLCARADLLELVSHHSYDLQDEAFLAYCARRGVGHVPGAPGSRRWEFFADPSRPKAEFLADDYFRLAEEYEGRHHRFSEQEMESQWRTIILGRAILEDCWELYQARALREA